MRSFLRSIFLLLALCTTQTSLAQDVWTPEELAPWVRWVSDRSPTLVCPIKDNTRLCSWPGSLLLDLNSNGGFFTYHVHLDTDQKVALPGNERNWPLGVTSKNNPIVVVRNNNKPYAVLKQGTYMLQGIFRWEALPKELAVPTDSGIIALRVNEVERKHPKISTQGTIVLLQPKDDAVELPTATDSLSIHVTRRLSDSLPFEILTNIEFRVSGSVREVALGKVFLSDTTPINIHSDLDYKLSAAQEFSVVLKPGTHSITIDERIQKPPTQLKPSIAANADWPKQEFWSWRANEQLRSVELLGATSIAPERANLPRGWQGLPTYVLTSADTLSFNELRRGEAAHQANQLSLNKTLWLSLDGESFTVSDTISGSMQHYWRLNAVEQLKLGSITIDQTPQLITADPKTKLSGVEVRNENLFLNAVSTLHRDNSKMLALGWDFDATSLQTTLHLPPGWQLFWTSGVDQVSDSWLSSWSLLDVFVVILVGVTSAKLLGLGWGLLGIFAFVASHNSQGAPYMLWFQLLAAVALLLVLPAGIFRQITVWYFRLIALCIVLALLPYCFYQIRSGLFPQLPEHVPTDMDFNEILVGLLSSFIFPTAIVIFFVLAIVNLFRKKWRNSGLLFLTAFTCWALPTLIVFFSYNNETTPYAPSYDGTYNESYTTSSAPMLEKATTRAAGIAAPQALSAAAEPVAESDSTAKLLELDPNAVVQTGPGIPNWTWKSWSLNWNGPVAKDHKISLMLLGPNASLGLTLLRVICIALFALALIRKGSQSVVTTALWLVLGAITLYPQHATAQNFPSDSLLEELELRINAKQCKENCTNNQQLLLELEGNTLHVSAVVTSDGPGAWIVPGPLEEYAVYSVRINDTETTSLKRDANGFLWVRIPAGKHDIEVSGELTQTSSANLQLPMPVGFVSFSSADWTADGISESGSVGPAIALNRKAQTTVSETAQADEIEFPAEALLSNWYLVNRTLDLGLKWQVATTVTRLGSTTNSSLVSIPLLEGESAMDSSLEQKDNAVSLSFARGQRQRSWKSSLAQNAELKLEASEQPLLSETWLINCSSIWNCASTGLNATSNITNATQQLRFDPWPTETVTVTVSKPQAVAGQSTTIESVHANYELGTRILKTTLNLSIRASKGSWQTITLPESAKIESILRDSQTVHVREEKNKLVLPVDPRSQNYQISFSIPYQLAMLQTVPAIDLGAPAVNIKSSVTLGDDRWLLFTSGPSWGPAVTFWGKLLSLILFAKLIIFAGMRRISFLAWILLGFGILSLEPTAMLVPIAWFALVQHREKNPLADKDWLFNLRQVALGLLTATFLIIAYFAIKAGLIHMPDMGVIGNNSSSNLLQWYLDRNSNTTLPEITVLTTNLWIWRGIMIAWSTWLVVMLLRWLKDGWEAFKKDQLWS